jgi:hypothetical protein
MYWTFGLNATPYASLTVNGVPQFQAANPAAGVPQGTSFTQAWFNDVQGENLNPVLYTGLTPAQNNPTQVMQAYMRLFGGRQVIVSGAMVLTADEMGFIELIGSATYLTTLPTPVGKLSPPIKIWNNSSVAQTIATAGGAFDGPGGNGTSQIGVAPNQIVKLCSDGFNYVVEPVGSPRGYYATNQSGTLSAPANSSQVVTSITITFPSFSRTGSFRVLARLMGAGNASAANVRQNFQNALSDGTNSSSGAQWMVYGENSADGWGVADTILLANTYAPGSTVTFTQSVLTAGGNTNFTIARCLMFLFIEEA